MMNDEFLMEYLQNPALQNKYGNYGNFRSFMLSQQQDNNTGGVTELPAQNTNAFDGILQLPQTFSEKAQGFVESMGGVRDLGKNIVLTTLANRAAKPKVMTPMVLGAQALGAILPKEDPQVTAVRNYYKGMYGLDDIGRIQQGELMAGYNPISGGALKAISGGKFGKDMNLGLERAYNKRIDAINKTLSKYQANPTKYKDKLENTTLFDKRDDLIRKRNQDALALQQIALQFASPVQKATIADFASGSMDTAAAMPTQPGAPVKDQGPVKQSKINQQKQAIGLPENLTKGMGGQKYDGGYTAAAIGRKR
tara:strand:+ start:2886 stop:3812 length:927 start_codon:yes stop_codon:yes gene_type:complete